MSARPKFLFDADFGAPPKKPAAPEEPMVPLAVHQAELARAAADAERRGRQAAEAGETARLASAMERLSHMLAASGASLSAAISVVERDAAHLAVAVARRLAGRALEAAPLAEVETLARRAFADLGQAPHVVVRVRDADLEAATQRLENATRDSGFTGRLVVLGDPDLLAGDIRVEWAGGGVAREGATLNAAVDAILAEALAPPTGA